MLLALGGGAGASIFPSSSISPHTCSAKRRLLKLQTKFTRPALITLPLECSHHFIKVFYSKLKYNFTLQIQGDKCLSKLDVGTNGTNTMVYILLPKTTAAKNEAALSYHRLRRLHFLAVVFVRYIYIYIYIVMCVISIEHNIVYWDLVYFDVTANIRITILTI